MDFELAFSDFLEQEVYDNVESALYDVVRCAFKTGWLAAGGTIGDCPCESSTS